jgi:hypothetical protein
MIANGRCRAAGAGGHGAADAFPPQPAPPPRASPPPAGACRSFPPWVLAANNAGSGAAGVAPLALPRRRGVVGPGEPQRRRGRARSTLRLTVPDPAPSWRSQPMQTGQTQRRALHQPASAAAAPRPHLRRFLAAGPASAAAAARFAALPSSRYFSLRRSLSRLRGRGGWGSCEQGRQRGREATTPACPMRAPCAVPPASPPPHPHPHPHPATRLHPTPRSPPQRTGRATPPPWRRPWRARRACAPPPRAASPPWRCGSR